MFARTIVRIPMHIRSITCILIFSQVWLGGAALADIVGHLNSFPPNFALTYVLLADCRLYDLPGERTFHPLILL